MAPAQGAAWDVYIKLARELLPALHDDQVNDAALNSQLDEIATRILRYAPLWAEHGPMLADALQIAVSLHRAGDRADLADLLRVMANRLYVLSAGPQRDGRDRSAP